MEEKDSFCTKGKDCCSLLKIEFISGIVWHCTAIGRDISPWVKNCNSYSEPYDFYEKVNDFSNLKGLAEFENG